MQYDRKRLQEVCQNELGYATPDEMELAGNLLRTIKITKSCADSLQVAASEDLKDFYFKGLLSLFEALLDISHKRYSWASVKIYYSVYYFLQVEMLSRGTGLVKAKGIHRITFAEGESFVKKSGKLYNSDHSGTIRHFIDLFGTTDPLLSNDVGGATSYEWLLKQRERVNYRERYFNEPDYPNFWIGPVSFGVTNSGIQDAIQTYIDDTSMAFAFQEDHAILAIPIRRLMITFSILKKYGHSNILSQEKKDFLRNMLFCDNLISFIEL